MDLPGHHKFGLRAGCFTSISVRMLAFCGTTSETVVAVLDMYRFGLKPGSYTGPNGAPFPDLL